LETQALYKFGKFRCDPREHLLLCEDKPVSVSPKCFEILVVLIQSNGRLLTKDELMQQVWPDSYVEEANLTVSISALRKALGEASGGQRYIETVPKLGYRFTASVSEYQNSGKKTLAVEAQAAVPVGFAEPLPPPVNASWARRRWPLVVLLLVCVVGSAILLARRQPKLTDKDTVVLADFANLTGDPVFDGALRQGLSSQLEQSPYLNLLSDERIAQTLSLMAQPKDSRLTHELAREVCQRTASTAVLYGTVVQVGTQYLITLKAINCSNGESLGSTEEQAADKNHVLEALGKVASRIRNQLGESLASVQKYDAPAENVTTASLEALKAYSLGYSALVVRSEYASAIPLFQRAISLDPNFAMAYARLGTSYFNIYETVKAASCVRKAYDLRQRVSEREKMYIASHYELFVTGNLEAARKIYELSSQTYPHDIPLNNLGLIYSELGDFDKALAAYQNVLKVSSGTGNRYANLASGYLQLDRLEEAKAAVKEAQSHNLDSPQLHLNLYWVNFLQHDTSGMVREAAQLIGKPGHEDQMLNYEADTALYGGQLSKARILTQRAIESAEKADEKEAAALYIAVGAVRETLVGNADLAKQQARAAIALSNSRDVIALSALSLEATGDSSLANRLTADLEKRFPEDTIVQFNYLPAIRAVAVRRAREGAQATETLASAVPYELGGNLGTVDFVLYLAYFRGEAYLAAYQGAAAAAEFKKILDHPGAVRSEPIGALAHLQLGRAYVLSGDRIKAKDAYQKFLALWKDADSDIPVFKQAQAEYSRLQ
jgi:DNA-binding winged helix-turn-helix (wHTH) protein/Flp pilus assembly protein TadD